MADWSDISDLWWLQPQRESGRALQGMALGAQAAQQRAQNERLERQSQLLMQQKQVALQNQETKARGLAAMSSYMADVAANNAWTDPKVRAGFYKLAASLPFVVDDPTFNALESNFTRADERADKARTESDTVVSKNMAHRNELLNQARQAEASGNKELAKSLYADASLYEQSVTGPQEQTEYYDPTTGTMVLRATKGGIGRSGLTSAVQSDLQRKAFTSEDAVRSGINLLGQINSETVGPLATFKSFALDKGLANIDPKFANPERIEARQGFRIWAENAIAAMKKDSQLNVPEEKRMLQAMSLLDTFTSPAEGKVQTAGFIRTMQDVTRQANQRQGKPIPQLAWNEKEIQAALTEGIVSGFKAGITKERAIELLTNLKAIEDARANK